MPTTPPVELRRTASFRSRAVRARSSAIRRASVAEMAGYSARSCRSMAFVSSCSTRRCSFCWISRAVCELTIFAPPRASTAALVRIDATSAAPKLGIAGATLGTDSARTRGGVMRYVDGRSPEYTR